MTDKSLIRNKHQMSKMTLISLIALNLAFASVALIEPVTLFRVFSAGVNVTIAFVLPYYYVSEGAYDSLVEYNNHLNEYLVIVENETSKRRLKEIKNMGVINSFIIDALKNNKPTEWAGGQCPLKGNPTIIVQHRGSSDPSNERFSVGSADSFRWSHKYEPSDIVSYLEVKHK